MKIHLKNNACLIKVGFLLTILMCRLFVSLFRGDCKWLLRWNISGLYIIIKKNILMLKRLKLKIISVWNGYCRHAKDLEQIFSGLNLFIGLCDSLSTVVSRFAKTQRKSSGVRLKRKEKGTSDNKKEEIILRYLQGENSRKIAQTFGVAQLTLYAFYCSRPEIKALTLGEIYGGVF